MKLDKPNLFKWKSRPRKVRILLKTLNTVNENYYKMILIQTVGYWHNDLKNNKPME